MAIGNSVHALAIGLAMGVLSSCTVALKSDATQCETAADCLARGPQFADAVCTAGICAAKPAATGPNAGTPFECVDAEPTATTTKSFSGKVLFYQLTKTLRGLPADNTKTTAAGRPYTPVAAAPVKVCGITDLDCANPVSLLTTDEAGAVDASFSDLTPSYLQSGDDGYHPLKFISPTRYRASDVELFVGRITTPEFVGFARSAGVDMTPSTDQTATNGPAATAGIVLVNVFDCNRAPAEGVSWTIDDVSGATRAYISSSGALSTSETATGRAGFAFFFNVKPGNRKITATYNGNIIDQSTIFVAAGVETITISHTP